jgi:gliding motility-associated-like protein
VNDEWKVSYQSLISFECHIFNRWGTEICSFTDPSQGWDGRYKGKFVPSGTYFYVIKAEGSDGVKYKKSGDINILKTRVGKSDSTTTTETE